MNGNVCCVIYFRKQKQKHVKYATLHLVHYKNMYLNKTENLCNYRIYVCAYVK